MAEIRRLAAVGLARLSFYIDRLGEAVHERAHNGEVERQYDNWAARQNRSAPMSLPMTSGKLGETVGPFAVTQADIDKARRDRP